MNIVVRNLSELHSAECNARRHPPKQIAELKRSLKKNGQIRLLVVDENNTVWIGNGLLEAMRDMGYTEAHCILKEGMTEAEKKKMMLSDNRIFDLGVDDMDAFDALIRELSGDLDIPGFDEDALSVLVADLSIIESALPASVEEAQKPASVSVVEDENLPEPEGPPAEPRSKRGQVYQLGRHRVMCGDSTSLTDVSKLMGGTKAQLLLTDPPYNVNVTGATEDKLKIENDNMSDAAFREFLYKALKTADFAMNPGAAYYIWHADSKGFWFREACMRVGWDVRQCLVWVKNTLVLGRSDYQWRHEPCLYGWKPGAAHLWASDRKQTTVFEYDKPLRSAEHPTMKPVELFERQMLNSSMPGDIVLDLFTGSGTTLVAAEQTNRIAYCMEYDPRYVDVIIDRWEALSGQQAVLVSE